MTGRRARARADKRERSASRATAPQPWWVVKAQEEAVADMVAGLNLVISNAQATVRNEDVDALIAERGTPQDLVNGAGGVLSLLWVRARHNGMAETEATKAALEEALLLVSDLLLKAWVRGAQGGGAMQPDQAPDSVEIRYNEPLTESEQDKEV